MTTIAYKEGIIAYDSRCTSGDHILNDSDDKLTISKGVRFFMAGRVSDQEEFVDQYFGDRKVGKNLNVSAFILDGGRLFLSSSDATELWVSSFNIKLHDAIGSGSDHAITAMDMGATAKEAVKWAMKRDTKTGGRIRTFRVRS